MKIQQSARVVIVTGTSQGIGQAIAQSYLDNGDIVIGCAFSALEKAANAQKMLAENPEHYFYYSVDVTKTESIKQFVNDAEKLFGRIDVVVSNRAVRPTQFCTYRQFIMKQSWAICRCLLLMS